MRKAIQAGTMAMAMLAVSWAGTAHADLCMSVKLKALGTLESSLLKCQAKVSATNDSSGLAECRSKATGKFDAAFAKAGICNGVKASCDKNASDCESAVVAAMADTLPSKCEAAKRKAAAKLSKAELNCLSKAAKGEVAVDADCLTKAQGKFAAAMTKAGACPDGTTPLTLVEDACVDSQVVLAVQVTDVCPDKDECTLATDNCSSDATCANTVGSFTCTCNPGFGGDGVTCTPQCGTDCWGEFGCLTGAGRCVKFTCRDGDSGPTFCDSCLGWAEVTYDQWMNQGYCGDVIAKYRESDGTQTHCGTAPVCCDGSGNCPGNDNAWHFSDGVNTHYTGPCLACPGDTDCAYWDSINNSPGYTRITACERML